MMTKFHQGSEVVLGKICGCRTKLGVQRREKKRESSEAGRKPWTCLRSISRLALLIGEGSFEGVVGGEEWESCLASYSGGLDSLFSPWPPSWNTTLIFIRSTLTLKYVDFIDW